eukprot:2197212-Lingulodinium_polyedra.AAC.1
MRPASCTRRRAREQGPAARRRPARGRRGLRRSEPGGWRGRIQRRSAQPRLPGRTRLPRAR